MNIKDIEQIIDKETNKIIGAYVLFVIILIAIEFYYQQQMSSLIVISVSISTSLILSTSLLKSTLIRVIKAMEEDKNKSDDGESE
jgi:low affinity Fe/Cu permease